MVSQENEIHTWIFRQAGFHSDPLTEARPNLDRGIKGEDVLDHLDKGSASNQLKSRLDLKIEYEDDIN